MVSALVLTAFVGLGFAGRDKANDLAYTTTSSLPKASRPSVTNRCSSVVAVLDRDGPWVVEHAHRIGELNTVLAPVRLPFGPVPLETHGLVYVQTMYMSNKGAAAEAGGQEPAALAGEHGFQLGGQDRWG